MTGKIKNTHTSNHNTRTKVTGRRDQVIFQINWQKQKLKHLISWITTLKSNRQNFILYDWQLVKIIPLYLNNIPLERSVHIIIPKSERVSLRKKCPYSELFWSVFPRIRTDLTVSVQMRLISPFSVRMREITDQNNSEYGHFSQSVSSENVQWNIFCLRKIFMKHFREKWGRDFETMPNNKAAKSK